MPHDVSGMVELMGGKEKVIADLTDFFNKTPSNMLWNEYYNHANEPVHFVPFFLFNQLEVPGILKNGHAIHVKRLMQTKLKGLLAMKM